MCASRLLKLPKLALHLIGDVAREKYLLELFLELLPSVDCTIPLPYFSIFTLSPQHGHLQKIQHNSVDFVFVALYLVTLEVILQVPQEILHLLRVSDAFEHMWLMSLDLGLP